MKRLIAIFALLFPLAAYAGMDEGIAAYTAGEYAKALDEFRPLADQGNPDGQYFLGFMYHNGFGMKPDQAEAMKWFEKSAAQGDSRSQYYAGIIYAAGKGGVKKDLVKADMWLTISAMNPKTSYRDSLYTKEEVKRIEQKMSPEQLAQAQELVKSWKPAN
ncbi:MAG TPA: tetratricopeptide repeat protein [Burkholderiales bacterium]|nr:tetratricopeptide repeat protein [Burkholderiales bacterium]